VSVETESLAGLQLLFKQIIQAYAKNEHILKVMAKWFYDINHLISAAYLIA